MTRELARALAKAEAAQPVSWRQLCAVAKDSYAPTIDDSEWAARIKDRLVALGFQSPRADEITKVIRAIERLVHRPSPYPTRPAAEPPPLTPRPLTRAEAAAIYADLRRRFLERTVSA